MASGSGIDDMGTEFEKSIYQLIVEDCDPGNNSSFPSKVFPSPRSRLSRRLALNIGYCSFFTSLVFLISG